MLRVVEAFSGIGSQAKALKNTGISFETVLTIEWDINAILAYCLIHKKSIPVDLYSNISDDEIFTFLLHCGLSGDGKNRLTEAALKLMHTDDRRIIYSAIKETNNLVDIKKIKGMDIPDNIDLFVYSFPCQDLSAARFFQKKEGGISKSHRTRSGLLWEVERILSEMNENHQKLPRILLMENVPAIAGTRYRKEFGFWKYFLQKLGYQNETMILDAGNFGIPQTRERFFMISVLTGENQELKDQVHQYYLKNSLEDMQHLQGFHRRKQKLEDILKTDYSNPVYLNEAKLAQPNETTSRKQIFKDNPLIFDAEGNTVEKVSTITTKQDRNPNSGLVFCPPFSKQKPSWRYLTPRECFLLMGFDEEDFNRICSYMGVSEKKKLLLSPTNLYRLAGNSIVVDVLEEIFLQLPEIIEMQKAVQSDRS